MRGALSILLLLLLSLPAWAGRAGEVRTEAFRLLNEGVTAYKKGRYAEAVEKLEASSGMALNSFRAYFYLGLSYIGDRRYADAIEALTVALDLDPSHVQSLVAMGDARLKQGDVDESRAEYFRALKLRPEYPAALDGLARIYEAQADIPNAISHYLRAINNNKGFAPAYTHLGDLYLSQDRFEEAVQLLEEAVSVRPDFGPGLNRLAIAYGRLGLDNQAVATIQKAMEIEPGNASHPATLGTLQLGQGFITTAERWFFAALELDPNLPDARIGLAEVARREGDYDRAFNELDTALEDPRLDAKTTKRLQAFRQAIEQERVEMGELENRVAAGFALEGDYSGLARIYAGRGLWDRAIELQSQADTTPQQQERLAYMLFRAGRYRESKEIYESLAGGTRSAELELNSGVSQALLGDDEAAVLAYRRALEIDDSHGRARLYLGNALLRLGRQQQAVEAYVRFLDQGVRGEAAERVRRILTRIAPEALPQKSRSPLEPVPQNPEVAPAVQEGAQS